MRTSLPAVLVLSALTACRTVPPETTAEPIDLPAAQTQRVETASLLRRLAEAVDGYRDGQPRFVIANRQPPHRVAGVFTSADSAADSLARLPDRTGYAVFGPYRAFEKPAPVVVAEEQVDSVIVVAKGGKRRVYLGAKVDALFWSLPAFDKFVVPYLTAVHGPRYAAQERERYRVNRSGLAHSPTVPHYRSSF
jgi:hypothetical protein